MPRNTKRFQIGLVYILLLSAVMGIYFYVQLKNWAIPVAASIGTFLIVLSALLITLVHKCFYTANYYEISLVVASTLLVSSFFCNLSQFFSMWNKDLSPAVCFAYFIIAILLIYTVLPLHFNTTVILACIFSMALEIMLSVADPARVQNLHHVIVNVLLHLCLHAVGIHIKITLGTVFEYFSLLLKQPFSIYLYLELRMRDTFMKVAQSMMVKKQLVAEKALKEKMIHSVMPPKLAEWLMRGHVQDSDDGTSMFPMSSTIQSSGDDLDGNRKNSNKLQHFGNGETSSIAEDSKSDASSIDVDFQIRKISSPRSSNQGDIRSIFRPFNMNTMDNVSILFADIVGFTKMSSNKTASQLVGLLNDLFGRFDDLCTQCGCEKISTLGDCYYCVSGCPEPTLTHATNCVEMGKTFLISFFVGTCTLISFLPGLAMIAAIKEFDEDRHESVNMRVGIHTGTVLCGIVGKTRFKFDVWSNDVNFANKMESTGKPGQVHISERTYSFLKNDYLVEDGEVLNGESIFLYIF